MDLSSPSLSLSTDAMPRKWARKAERYCCLVATYFPLAFVYSITTWAVWVEATIGTLPTDTIWVGKGTSLLGVALWALLNWSYTTAVFTSPGTTISTNGYSSLPTQAAPAATNFTVKANGELRYCKKCQARKPDRAHHCSTCRTCVLKMDHHCPWLATCVGLRNYKAFMLFLIYTTLFCWISFAVSGVWVYAEIFNEGQNSDSLMPINYVMLAVLSGIIGLVLAGFTGWHILLASKGQTTIECLEKTRYLSPLRRSTQDPNYGQQMRDMANGHTPQGQQYDAYERTRARQRYDEYLDEQDSEKLPSAFDLGWKRNLHHLFGPSKTLWFVPICNTTGDGWSWEPSPTWLAARGAIQKERHDQRVREHAAGWGAEPSPQNLEFPAQTIQHQRQKSEARQYVSYPSRSTSKADKVLGRSISKADKILGRDAEEYADGGASLENQRPRGARDPYDIDDEGDGFTMQNLRSKREAPDPYDISSDEEEADRRTLDRKAAVGWHRKVGIATNTLLGNTAARQKDDVRGWDGQDEGVD